jgi:hypothetical protein
LVVNVLHANGARAILSYLPHNLGGNGIVNLVDLWDIQVVLLKSLVGQLHLLLPVFASVLALAHQLSAELLISRVNLKVRINIV